MAVKIRLRRMGTRGKPFYRIVVADGRSPRDGRFIEILGHYDPRTEPPTLKINEEQALHWLNRGAQPSDTVEALLKKENIFQKFLASKEKPAKESSAPVAKAAAPAVEEAATITEVAAPAEDPVVEPKKAAPKKKTAAAASAKPKAAKPKATKPKTVKAKAVVEKPAAEPEAVAVEPETIAESEAAVEEQPTEEQG